MSPRLAVTVAAAALALAPASARAACAVPDLDAAPVDALARPLPGPSVPGGSLLSPARFSVVVYEKGNGPRDLLVTTGAGLLPTGTFVLIGEGLFPHPGELWRLYGHFDATGVLQSGTCDGSHMVPDPPPAPALTVGRRTVTALESTLLGLTRTRAPRIIVTGRVLKLQSSLPLISVRSVRKDVELARGAGQGIVWSVRVPRGESRLVVDTGDRAYTVGVLSRLSHR